MAIIGPRPVWNCDLATLEKKYVFFSYLRFLSPWNENWNLLVRSKL